MNLPSITAHRGYSGAFPENTRSAFMYALETGADGIESDFHLSKDGVPIAFHDFSLKRITGKSGGVKDYDYKELKALDYSSWKGVSIPEKYGRADEQLVTLGGLLDILLLQRRDIKFLLEFKHPSPFGHQLEETVMETLKNYGYDPVTSEVHSENNTVKVIFMSFSYSSLVRLVEKHSIDPQFISPLFSNSPRLVSRNNTREDNAKEFALEHKSSVIGAGLKYVKNNEEEVKRWANEGREFSVWTVDSGADALYLQCLGVQGITTNYPVEVRESLRQSQTIHLP